MQNFDLNAYLLQKDAENDLPSEVCCLNLIFRLIQRYLTLQSGNLELCMHNLKRAVNV